MTITGAFQEDPPSIQNATLMQTVHLIEFQRLVSKTFFSFVHERMSWKHVFHKFQLRSQTQTEYALHLQLCITRLGM